MKKGERENRKVEKKREREVKEDRKSIFGSCFYLVRNMT